MVPYTQESWLLVMETYYTPLNHRYQSYGYQWEAQQGSAAEKPLDLLLPDTLVNCTDPSGNPLLTCHLEHRRLIVINEDNSPTLHQEGSWRRVTWPELPLRGLDLNWVSCIMVPGPAQLSAASTPLFPWITTLSIYKLTAPAFQFSLMDSVLKIPSHKL